MPHSSGPTRDHQRNENRVTLRSPAELAAALPYLVGYHPDDSIVVVGVHGPNGRFGGRIRLGIPSIRSEWPDAAREVAECLLGTAESYDRRPESVVVYLCQEPRSTEQEQEQKPERGQDAMERLRPLAKELGAAFAGRGMPMREALCLSAGHFWSYTCPDPQCCSPDGQPVGASDTSALAAAAAYAGVRVRGSLRELTAGLLPFGPPRAERQERALDRMTAELLPDMLTPVGRYGVRRRTLRLVERLFRRLHAVGAADSSGAAGASPTPTEEADPTDAPVPAPGLAAADVPAPGGDPAKDPAPPAAPLPAPVPAPAAALDAAPAGAASDALRAPRSRQSGPPGADPAAQDARDDAVLSDEEAATVIVGLQDRTTRDRAAEWMEGPEAAFALRLWRALCRRCVGAYAEYAAAPLALVGWVSWSCGDEPVARVALCRALEADPEYAFAQLVHSACNRGLDPEPLRECLRQQRAGYEVQPFRAVVNRPSEC